MGRSLTCGFFNICLAGHVLRDRRVQELACSWAFPVLQGQLGFWTADTQRSSHTAPSAAHHTGERSTQSAFLYDYEVGCRRSKCLIRSWTCNAACVSPSLGLQAPAVHSFGCVAML